MDPSTNRSFLVDMQDLAKTSFSSASLPDLADGELLLKIDRYAFTSNNITYAVVGPRIGYWKFFPAEAPWGIVPVWGFAEVTASQVPEIPVGERFYGYYPMSDYLKVRPVKVAKHGFTDGTGHRQELPTIYNYYQRTSSDSALRPDNENYYPILKPLFATSFLNYHFLAEETFFEADQVVITSASSKTALGLAHLLKKNQLSDQKEIVGLTSASNVAFVEKTGYYDLVIAYDKVKSYLPDQKTTVVDMAGNSSLLKTIHQMTGDRLRYVSLIGLTDWKSEKAFREIPQAKFFFAPSHAQQKYQQWGIEQTNAQISSGLGEFIKDAQNWIELDFIQTLDAVQELYLGMLDGRVDPSKGYIVQITG